MQLEKNSQQYVIARRHLLHGLTLKWQLVCANNFSSEFYENSINVTLKSITSRFLIKKIINHHMPILSVMSGNYTRLVKFIVLLFIVYYHCEVKRQLYSLNLTLKSVHQVINVTSWLRQGDSITGIGNHTNPNCTWAAFNIHATNYLNYYLMSRVSWNGTKKSPLPNTWYFVSSLHTNLSLRFVRYLIKTHTTSSGLFIIS